MLIFSLMLIIKHKLFFPMSDIQTDEDQTIKTKKCQTKLNTYVQLKRGFSNKKKTLTNNIVKRSNC